MFVAGGRSCSCPQRRQVLAGQRELNCTRSHVVCRGQRRSNANGSFSAVQESNPTRQPREDAAWWQTLDAPAWGAAAPASPAAEQGPGQGPRQRHGGGGGPRGGGRQDGGRRRRVEAWEVDEDDKDDGPGWWEVPREQRLAAAAAAAVPAALEPWQERRLRLAFAVGRRKVAVQALAAELGMDRSEVTHWFKEFQGLPVGEREAALAPLRQSAAQQRQQLDAAAAAAREALLQRRADAAAAKTGASGGGVTRPDGDRPPRGATASLAAPAAAAAAAASPAAASPAAPARGAAAAAAGGRAAPRRRLPGNVVRTLETVYSRMPYPPRDVIAGLYDLHRLSREEAQQWFTDRRDADGRPHDPRLAKQQQQQQQQSGRGGPGTAVGAGAADEDDDDGWSGIPGVSPMGAGALGAQAAPAPVRVQRLTQRQMVALRSSLPSPRKVKGSKLREELGIKPVADAGPQEALEVAGVRYMAKDGGQAWRGVWRRRRAGKGLPAQRLDFQQWLLRGGRGGEAGGGAEGAEQAVAV